MARGGPAATAAPTPSPPDEALPGDGLSDEALVARLRDGDAAAGEALVRRHHLPLLRYLLRVAGDEHLAEELLQATWLSALEHLDRFDSSWAKTGGFKAWLFRIATNKATDLWRARGREKQARQGLKLVVESESPDAGHRLAGSEQSQKLLRAIEQLPESQRQVLLLRYYAEMKFVQIAQLLGCPLNTALGRMHKAMLKLKELMAE
ncbi:RNA polymerase sigma factor [Fontivita pretiosa]|uniref:RNA polymerase sigma factor n=1 Tax=Fontivita pretiosa TaxID=2989684 RepID=UPI003D1840B7